MIKMVYELYQLTDKGEELPIFAILQTITMRCVVIGRFEDVEAMMKKIGLIQEYGWDLSKASKIDYHDYNTLISIL